MPKQDLLAFAQGPIVGSPPVFSDHVRQKADPTLLEQLRELLVLRNGFFAFDRALHIFPAAKVVIHQELNAWNESDVWKTYAGMADGCVFFAEDLFGGQFCLRQHAVYAFEPETGAQRLLADSIDAWADVVRADCDFLTGRTVAREWQQLHGSIDDGNRLVPIVPFVLGGEYEVSNLRSVRITDAMYFNAKLATEIQDVPDGGAIRVTTKADPSP